MVLFQWIKKCESFREEGAKPGSSSWKDIQPYLTADDHLRRPDKDRYKPETGLETQINTAIKKGEFVKAEDLSDQLSSRQVSCVLL